MIMIVELQDHVDHAQAVFVITFTLTGYRTWKTIVILKLRTADAYSIIEHHIFALVSYRL